MPSTNVEMQPQAQNNMAYQATPAMQEVSLAQQAPKTETADKEPSLWMRGRGVIGDCIDAIVCFECCKGCCDCCC